MHYHNTDLARSPVSRPWRPRSARCPLMHKKITITPPPGRLPASSQPQPAGEPPADGGVIVVTAQKRAENVQDVPISIAAFSGETLEKNNVVNIEDLAKITPNFSTAKGAQTSYVRLNIRGIGAASNTTVEPSVAVFLDGAYVPRAGAVISSMLDMESVEVLRGPQGTCSAATPASARSRSTPRAEVRRFLGRSDRRDRQRRPLQGLRLCQRAGRRQQRPSASPARSNGSTAIGTTISTASRLAAPTTNPARQLPQRSRPLRVGVPRRLCQAEGRRRDQHRLRPDSVSDAQWTSFSAFLGAPDTDLNDRTMNQFLTADVDDKQWGVNSTLSWDIGGGSRSA